ncbi:penicillin-binding protein [Pseudonocardia kujensis]|nr:penicillin-binding protein [Pseudonocardia kujensis]
MGVLCVVGGVLLAGMVFPVVSGLGLTAGEAGAGGPSVPAILADRDVPLTTTVTDDNGEPIAYLFDQDRRPTPSATISPAMKAAIVAVEDRRFYQHSGVDPQGVLRALLHNGESTSQQGGSTLSQQYVKNYTLDTATTAAERTAATAPTYARKLSEARLAVAVDRALGKDEILTRYLNIVYFGNGAYGVGTAARTYFDTTPDRLTVAQAALLAGMVQSPTAYDPLRHPAAATARRNEVIQLMAGQGVVTPVQAAASSAEPLGVPAVVNPPAEGCAGAGDAGHFCAYVVDYLTRAGFSLGQLDRGGYIIRTTLDRAALAAAKAAVDAQVPPRTPHIADVLSIVEPGATGHRVVAMAANRTYGPDAAAGQSSYGLPYTPENLGAGSVYKIFTAAAALEKGLGIDTVLDVPASGWTTPFFANAGVPVPIHNAGNYASRLSLQDALAQSPNTAFVALEQYTGVPAVVDMAVRLGMTSLADTPTGSRTGSPSIATVTKAQNHASFTLGDTPTSALELANVAATLASHGTWCPPDPIAAITDRTGTAVPLPGPACNQAVSPQLADTLLTGLSKDDQPGGTSAAAARAANWNRPVAAKTGTTQNYESAAFVGATPQLAGATIVFDDSPSPAPICVGSPPHTCSGGNIYGGLTPAATWYQAMTRILGDQPPLPLPATDSQYVTGGAIASIPDVVGQDLETATDTLRRAGFGVETSSVDNLAPADTVMGESPRGDSLVGRTVHLDVSSGRVPPPPAAPGR